MFRYLQSARSIMSSLCIWTALCVAPVIAAAEPAKEFYAGKTITMVIGYPPGGTYDLYARTIARHLGKHIAGTPTVIIQNMPGASAVIATNYVVNSPVQDGTLIGAIGSTVPFQPLLDTAAAKFDPVATNWLPSPAGLLAVIAVWHTVPVDNFEDLKHREVLMATLTPVSTPSFYTAIFNHLFKTKLKLIFGYENMAAAFLAMERGEVGGFPSTPWDSVKRAYHDLYVQKKIKILLQYGAKPTPDLPNVPFASDLATAPDDKLLLQLATGPLKIAYPYLMGPKVPAERLNVIRTAFMDVFKDPEFRADAMKQTLDISPVSSDEVQQIVAATYGAPKAITQTLRDLYQAQVK